MKKIILFFGSFNPVHTAHISISEYVLMLDLAEELWFIVSPLNPFKNDDDMASETDRLEMLKIAVSHSRYFDKMKISDIEFEMPRPSFTISTLKKLWKTYPDYDFSILMGEDNLQYLKNWKNSKDVLKNCKVFVYRRNGYSHDDEILSMGNIVILDNPPLYDISSTELRNLLRSGGNTTGFLPEGVYNYLKERKIYATNNNDR